VRVRVEADDRTVEGVTVIVQNGDPFTYFRNRPIRICPGRELDDGQLGLSVLKKATPGEIPTVIARVFSSRAETVQRHRQIEGIAGVDAARVVSVDDRRFPLQVDGDFIGEFDEVEYRVGPRTLSVLS
jgi:diacylglycerol kinase family enzyme